jgi:hypothetical protein
MKIRSVLNVDLAKESDGCHLELRGSANNGDNPVMRLGLHGRSVMEEIVITVGMENTNITQRFFPWKPKPGKPTYSIFIHSDTLFTIQYTYRSQRHPKP